MGIEFMSDARRLQQAGGAAERRTPAGFVVPLAPGPSPVAPRFGVTRGCPALY